MVHTDAVAPWRAVPPSQTAVGGQSNEGWPLPPFVTAGLAGLLAVTATLPPAHATVVALVAVILLGVPHGALDGEVARPLLRPRFGRAWFAVFAPPYLSLAAAVLVTWRVAPQTTLAAFLAVSVLHFGGEDAGSGRPLEALARGGLPVALPVLLCPGAVAHLFEVVILSPLPLVPGWLHTAALVWAVLLLPAVAIMAAARRWRGLAEMAVLALSFLIMPPLAAFAFYFVALHAPRHMVALANHPRRALRVRSLRNAVSRSVPVTALTLLLGAMLWPLFPGPPPDRLLALTLQGLAALTLPHLLLGYLASRRDVAGDQDSP